MSFEVVSTSRHRLWDYGTFDVTSFNYYPADQSPHGSRELLSNFLADPISQRSFCENPDPWGASIGRRGPFIIGPMNQGWYSSVSSQDLEGVVLSVLLHREFSEPPSIDQQSPVHTWLQSAKDQHISRYILDAPDDPAVRVEFAWIWDLYHEFITIDPSSRQLTLAVICFD